MAASADLAGTGAPRCSAASASSSAGAPAPRPSRSRRAVERRAMPVLGGRHHRREGRDGDRGRRGLGATAPEDRVGVAGRGSWHRSPDACAPAAQAGPRHRSAHAGHGAWLRRRRRRCPWISGTESGEEPHPARAHAVRRPAPPAIPRPPIPCRPRNPSGRGRARHRPSRRRPAPRRRPRRRIGWSGPPGRASLRVRVVGRARRIAAPSAVGQYRARPRSSGTSRASAPTPSGSRHRRR